MERNDFTAKGVGEIFNRLRGIGNNQSVGTSDKPRSPYANMNDETFAVVLGTCLENVVRCENMGFKSQVKREALEEFDAVIKEAQKRFPDIKPAQVGEYFKDKDYAQAEAKLFAYAKEACKNDSTLGMEIKKHESWRDNKDFEGHEALMITNLNEEKATIELVFVFEDREPETGIMVRLDGMRTTCIRLDKPLGEKGFSLGESVQYTVWVKSDIPVCACFGRLDVRQANMAYYSVEGYSF